MTRDLGNAFWNYVKRCQQTSRIGGARTMMTARRRSTNGNQPTVRKTNTDSTDGDEKVKIVEPPTRIKQKFPYFKKPLTHIYRLSDNYALPLKHRWRKKRQLVVYNQLLRQEQNQFDAVPPSMIVENEEEEANRNRELDRLREAEEEETAASVIVTKKPRRIIPTELERKSYIEEERVSNLPTAVSSMGLPIIEVHDSSSEGQSEANEEERGTGEIGEIGEIGETGEIDTEVAIISKPTTIARQTKRPTVQQQPNSSTIVSASRATADNLFLAKGAYGCVYKQPGLTCAAMDDDAINSVYHNSSNPIYVSKLLTKVSAVDEIRVGKHLKQKDPQHKYFIYLEPDSACVASQNQIESCSATIVERKIKSTQKFDVNEFVNYSMLYGGQTYSSYLYGLAKSENTKAMYKGLISLWTILTKLHEFGVIHRDITPVNLLYDESSSTPLRLIDFGLASLFYTESGKNGTSLENVLRSTRRFYRRWPPEMWATLGWKPSKLWARIQGNVNKNASKNAMIWMKHYKKFRVPKSNQEASAYTPNHPLMVLIQKLAKHDSIRNPATINDRMQKVDTFMMSQLSLLFLNNYGSRNTTLYKEALKLFVKGCSPIATERPLAKKMLRNLESILKPSDISN